MKALALAAILHALLLLTHPPTSTAAAAPQPDLLNLPPNTVPILTLTANSTATLLSTLDHCRQRAGTLRCHITLAPGEYNLLHPSPSTTPFTPLELTEAHAGLTLSGPAPPSAPAILSGGWQLPRTGWTPPATGSHIWRLNITAAGGPAAAFGQLFLTSTATGTASTQRLVRARSPNTNRFHIMADQLLPGNPTGGFVYQRGDLDALASITPADGVEVVLYRSWLTARRILASIDPSNATALLAAPAGVEPTGNSGGRYYVENHASFVDAEGEWHLDPQTSVLSLYAATFDPRTAVTLTASVATGDLLRLTNTSDVSVSNLQVLFADWDGAAGTTESGNVQAASFLADAAVHLQNCRRCTLTNVTVAHTGSYGFWVDNNSQDCQLLRCVSTDTGAGGLRIGRGKPLAVPPPGQRTSGTLVQDCTFVLGSQVFREGNGILLQQSSNNTLDHNEVAFFNHVGICVGWTWDYSAVNAAGNIVTSNHVHHVGNGDLSDLAGIYLLGMSPGTRVADNHIHSSLAYTIYGHGLYLDQAASSIVVEGNLAHHTLAAAMYQHFGRDNLVRNNIFALSTGGYGLVWQAALQPSFDPSNFIIDTNIFYGSSASGGTFQCPYRGNGTFDRNIYFPPSASFPTSTQSGAAPCNASFQAWQAAGNDAHSQQADPLFVNASALDFALQPGSPALPLGFRPLNTSDAGPRGAGPAYWWLPACVGAGACAVLPPAPPNGHTVATDTLCGSTAVTECDPGFFLASGDAQRTCLGAAKGWSGTAGQCLPVKK